MQIFAAGPHFQGFFCRDHHRTDIQRHARAVGYPAMFQPHQFPYRSEMFLNRHQRHAHATGRLIEAFSIQSGAEQVDVAIVPPIGLGPVEDHLSVVVDRRGRIKLERPVGTDSRVVPAVLCVVTLGEHAVGEHSAEAEWRGERHRIGLGGVLESYEVGHSLKPFMVCIAAGVDQRGSVWASQ